MKSSQLKTALLISTTLAVLVTRSWAASNLNFSKSNINREFPRAAFVTASTDISGAVSQIVYRTPVTGDFVLTQVCVGPALGGILLQAGGVSIAQVGSGLCQTFTPGMVLPADQLVTCTTSAGDTNTFCTITGVLGTPAPTPRP